MKKESENNVFYLKREWEVERRRTNDAALAIEGRR